MREPQKDIYTYPHPNVKCLVQTGYIREFYALMPDKTINELIAMLEILEIKDFDKLLDKLMQDRINTEEQRAIKEYKENKKIDAEIQAELKAKRKK